LKTLNKICPINLMACSVLLSVVPFAVSAAEMQTPYHIVKSWKLGGEGRWDYLTVDSKTHTLYVSRGTRVMVIDTRSGKVKAEIGPFKFVHGITLDDQGKNGYISDGYGNAVGVFDRASNRLLASIPVGVNPDGIVFEPTTNAVFAFNGKSKNVSIIDAGSNKVVATLDLPGKPEFPVVDGKGAVFANIETSNEVVRIDAKSKKVMSKWSLSPCEGPSGLALDREHRKLFSVCDGNKMVISDPDAGRVVATAPIGEEPDATGYDPARAMVFSSNGGSGTLTIIHQDSPVTYSVRQTLRTSVGSRTMAFDASDGSIYLPSAQFGPNQAPSPTNPKGRPEPLPGSFSILVVGPTGLSK
jgi:DNA-binding beta-propeller fold protein YncE